MRKWWMHLLQTPQYGEKMAVHWMDVARYADSYGYQDDNIRTQWPWRDWVIHAFNKNIPYDQFLTWQIAGDMLPDASKEKILATGFFRNHKYTEEGGVIDEEYRIEYLLDKTKTFSKGIIGYYRSNVRNATIINTIPSPKRLLFIAGVFQ